VIVGLLAALGGLLGNLDLLLRKYRSHFAVQRQPVIVLLQGSIDADRQQQPEQGFFPILLPTIILPVQFRDTHLRRCKALVGGEAIPVHGLGITALYAKTFGVHLADFPLRVGVALRGG